MDGRYRRQLLNIVGALRSEVWKPQKEIFSRLRYQDKLVEWSIRQFIGSKVSEKSLTQQQVHAWETRTPNHKSCYLPFKDQKSANAIQGQHGVLSRKIKADISRVGKIKLKHLGPDGIKVTEDSTSFSASPVWPTTPSKQCHSPSAKLFAEIGFLVSLNYHCFIVSFFIYFCVSNLQTNCCDNFLSFVYANFALNDHGQVWTSLLNLDYEMQSKKLLIKSIISTSINKALDAWNNTRAEISCHLWHDQIESISKRGCSTKKRTRRWNEV